jgi:hypothetical protein
VCVCVCVCVSVCLSVCLSVRSQIVEGLFIGKSIRIPLKEPQYFASFFFCFRRRLCVCVCVCVRVCVWSQIQEWFFIYKSIWFPFKVPFCILPVFSFCRRFLCIKCSRFRPLFLKHLPSFATNLLYYTGGLTFGPTFGLVTVSVLLAMSVFCLSLARALSDSHSALVIFSHSFSESLFCVRQIYSLLFDQ